MTHLNYKNFVDSPPRDWKIIILFSLVSAIAILLFCYYLYSRISKEDIFAIEGSEKAAQVLDEEKIRSAAGHYRSKDARFEALLRAGASSASADPSL